MPTMRDEDRAASSRRLRLMAAHGAFPLWSVTGGGMTPAGARDRLGLADDLIEDLVRWGHEGDSTVPVPGGQEGWRERGADLRRRLQEALGPEYEVVYVAD